MTKAKSLVFFEFPEEVDAYLRELHLGNSSRTSTTLISLNPRTQAYSGKRGLVVETALPYFSNDSHTRALRKSNEISEWLWQQARFQDNLGVSFAYTQSLIWYLRLVVHHFLWLLEIIHNATERHSARLVKVFPPSLAPPSGHRIGATERYLWVLAESYCRSRGLSVEFIGAPGSRPPKRSIREVARDIRRFLAKRILAPTIGAEYLSYLNRLGVHRPVLFTAREYRMSDAASAVAREKHDLSMVLMRDWCDLYSLASLFGFKNDSPFKAEAWLGILEPIAREDETSRRTLQSLLKDLAAKIEGAPELFSYLGIPFAGHVRRKLDAGIGPFIVSLHGRAATLQLLLETLRPSAVVSTGNRDDDMIVGELCVRGGIPAMMIEHGSHVSPRNDLERIEWGAQAQRLLLAPFPYVALQSPLAEGFLKAFPSDSKGVRTGPIVWGFPVNRERSASLRGRMLNGDSSKRIVVHANTPKGRGSNRFHVYETPDEYVRSLRDLVAAVETIPDVHLIVKFRPSQDISAEDIRALVPFSERVTLSIEEPFLEVLGFADLLVSFSSTTIEEALQNQVPVLLYGGGGRYQHVPGVEISPEDPCPRAAVYVIRRQEHLAAGLRRILDIQSREYIRADLFTPYCFGGDSQVRLVDWLSSARESMISESRSTVPGPI